jgi:glycosyltransferase involved in cell wall biosynthesis
MRVLLISYYFPPFNTVGAVRPGKFAKFLIQNGHHVEVLCAHKPPFPAGMPLEVPEQLVHQVRGWSVNAPLHWLLGGRERTAEVGFQGVSVGNPLVRRLGRWYKTLFHWPDAEIGWVGAAVARGIELMGARPFDVIYVSAPPFSALRVGATLSAIRGVPWVADFRDLWSDNHAYVHPRWRRLIDRCWESGLLKTASALTTVSSPLATKLERHGLPTWVVRNGYDPDDFQNLSPANDRVNEHELLIVYTGNIYLGHHDVDTFCEGLSIFAARGRRARVKVVGRNVAILMDAAKRYGVSSFFDISSTVPRSEALALQKAADVLLMFLWGGGEDGIYTTKFFEYVGAERSILAIGASDNDVGQWIRSASLGKIATKAEEVADELIRWEEQKRSGEVLQSVSDERYEFTRGKQFSALVDHLHTVIKLVN